MDTTTRLIVELQTKLQELDSKVETYRHGLVVEFERYSDKVLHGVPQHVADEVSRLVFESAANYASLYPSVERPESPAAVEETRQWDGRKSPPPKLSHTSVRRDVLRSPHEREQEFVGVFTPTYLPLLDGQDRPPQPSPKSPPPDRPIDDSQTTEDTQTSEEFVRPAPLRRQTDTSSIDSSGSETRTRRSAMRRSSSASNRSSPRRVRFSVLGEEVLPTASPQTSGVALPQLGADPPSGGLAASESPAQKLLSPDETEGEGKITPAKKVSSSERLRALSKLPLEDPANWISVNPQPVPDEPALMNTNDSDNSPKPTTHSVSERQAEKRPAQPGANVPGQRPFKKDILGSPLQDLEAEEGQNDSSDDDFISMRPAKKSSVSPILRSPASSMPQDPPTKKSAGPRRSKTATHVGAAAEVKKEISSQTVNRSTNGNSATTHPFPTDNDTSEDDEQQPNRVGSEDDDDLFDFDEERSGSSQPSHLKPKPRPYLAEDIEPDVVTRTHDVVPLSESPSISPSRQDSPPIQTSVGSYKGRLITTFDVVKDPRIHQQATELGDFNTFVGSVDGRSGVDSSNLNSLRAFNAQFSGTPRSLSERMALEDAMAARQGR